MKSIIALIQQNRALSLAFFAVFLFCVGIYLYTRWDTARFEAQLAKPKQADSPAQSIPDETAQGGHSHHDQGLKSKAKPWIPEPPPDDPFFATIVFPDTPPSTQHVPSPSPFPVPEVIRNNPHLFEVNEIGHWNVIHLEEHMQKIETFRGELTGDAYSAKMAEVLAEGLPPLTAAVYLVSHGLVRNKHILPYVEQARAENPDDFETLKLWADAYSKEKPQEAEAIYRRLVKMRPNSLRAHYTLGKHILDTHPNPTEAISYLEKAYQLNPKWYGPLMGLGDVYHKLGQKEKAYKYFQAGRALGYSRM